uniref:F-box domain-containing protein n=1 Tax=Panagrolaimus davidi TaxID=227884 RepID=A0A914Q7X3_9BILA
MEEKLIFNRRNLRKQDFSIPSKLVSYIINAANGSVMQKLHRTCKYFCIQAPYLIIETIVCDADQCRLENEEYNDCILYRPYFGEVFRRPNTNIWVTKKFVDLDDGRHIKETIAKCTVTELHLKDLDTSFSTIQLLAKWNTIKKVVLDNVDSKKCDPFQRTSFGYAYATAEDLISCFPNAEHIRIKCARRRSTPSDAMNQLLSIPWTSKIKSLFLEDVKKPIHGDLYFQFLKEHAAENASFGINFGKEAKNPQAGSLKRKFESLMSNDLELSIKRPKFEVSVYGENILGKKDCIF